MFRASLSKFKITSSLVRRKRGIERTRERGTEVADRNTWKIFKLELKRWNREILESENANSEILFLETNILTLWRNMISLLFCWRSEQRLAERWRGIGRWRSTGWRRRREKQKWPSNQIDEKQSSVRKYRMQNFDSYTSGKIKVQKSYLWSTH